MTKIAKISAIINEFFNQTAELISISTNFIQRKRKLTGSAFLKAMVFGNMQNINCSIEGMCGLLAVDKIAMSKQGLDFRFTDTAVKFMERMYQESMLLFKQELLIDCKILQQFTAVKLLDSTYISLPNCMQEQYKGYGSSYKHSESNTKSAIKLQLTYDYLNQVVSSLDLTEGVRADQGYRGHLKNISSGNLLITDLGYFGPKSFAQIEKLDAYFISRYKADTNIYDVTTGDIIDLVEYLDCKTYIATEVFLGKEIKLKVRIIASKLTPEQSVARRRKANQLAKSRGYTSSEKNQKLLDWSIFITNITEDKLSNEQVMTIYRIRWQIELLFKLYKSQMNIDKLAGRFKAGRVLCEFYAKLCAILMFHGIASCLELKKDIEISLTKAVIEFKKRARELFLALSCNINKVEIFLQDLINIWSKFSLKDRKRKKRISTLKSLQLLLKNP